MNLLALDLGNTTGFAIFKNGEYVCSGHQKWDKHKEPYGVRYRAFHEWLKTVILAYDIDTVAYEEVHRFMSSRAAAVYNGYMTVVVMVCSSMEVDTVGYPPTSVKFVVTGNGHADKKEVRQNVEKILNIDTAIEDESDAIAVAICVIADSTEI